MNSLYSLGYWELREKHFGGLPRGGRRESTFVITPYLDDWCIYEDDGVSIKRHGPMPKEEAERLVAEERANYAVLAAHEAKLAAEWKASEREREIARINAENQRREHYRQIDIAEAEAKAARDAAWLRSPAGQRALRRTQERNERFERKQEERRAATERRLLRTLNRDRNVVVSWALLRGEPIAVAHRLPEEEPWDWLLELGTEAAP